MTRPLRVALVAGEASGDFLGAGLMQALREQHAEVEFLGVGGPQMEAAGLDSLFPMDALSVMGLTEVLGHLPRLLRLRRQLVRTLRQAEPDLFIGIDSPDFNLPVAARLRRHGIRTAHYVSPTVWAWRQGRVKGIRRHIDHMLTLLPFEARFYEEAEVPVTFVGHPMADEIPLRVDTTAARAELGLAPGRWVAILPGSRRGEVERLLPTFLDAARQLHQRHPELGFVIPAASAQRHEEICAQLQAWPDLPVILVEGRSRTVMAAADTLLLASGTATLEGLLLKKPMVVGYRVGRITHAIVARLLHTPWVALANLLVDAERAPELIQHDFTANAVARAVEYWLEHPDEAARLAEHYEQVHEQLRRDASRSAARALQPLLAGVSDG